MRYFLPRVTPRSVPSTLYKDELVRANVSLTFRCEPLGVVIEGQKGAVRADRLPRGDGRQSGSCAPAVKNDQDIAYSGRYWSGARGPCRARRASGIFHEGIPDEAAGARFQPSQGDAGVDAITSESYRFFTD